MRRAVLAVVLAATAVAGACAGEASVLGPAVATIRDLTGPWRPTPLLPDPSLREFIATTCIRDMERKPGSILGVIDTRGLGVAVVRMTGQSAGTCDALQITDGGQVMGAGGGWTQDGIEQLQAIGDTEIQDVQVGQVGGGELKTQGWSVMGRAGPAIASVVVETPNQPQILATLENGWFAAWWPATIQDFGRGQPMPPEVPYVVRGYGADGTLLTEVSN